MQAPPKHPKRSDRSTSPSPIRKKALPPRIKTGTSVVDYCGVGIGANGTYVKSKDIDAVELLGTSKSTYKVGGFYDDDKVSASLAWNCRSDYAIGFIGDGTNAVLRDAAGNITQYNGQHRYAGEGSLSLSLGYKVTPSMCYAYRLSRETYPGTRWM